MVIHWDDLWERFKEVMHEFRGQTIGMIGLGIIIMMLLLGIFAPFIAPDTNGEWDNTERWQDNPRNAAPVWADYLQPGSRARHKVDHDIVQKENETVTGTDIHINEYEMKYNMDYDYPPDDIYAALKGDMINPSDSRRQSFQNDVERPDNRTYSRLIEAKSDSSTSESFNRRFYLGRSSEVRDRIYNWGRPYAEGKSGMVARNLEVSPSIVTPGDTVNIVGRLKNLGNNENTTSLTIDGEEVGTYTVEGGDSLTLSPGPRYPELSQTFEEKGTYDIKLGDQQWTVSVVDEDKLETDIEVTNLEDNYYAQVGDEVNFKFTANNTSNETIEDSVYVSGNRVKNFTIPPAEMVDIDVSFKVDSEGTVPIMVGDQTSRVFVSIPGLPTRRDIDPVQVMFSKANEDVLSNDPDPLKGEYTIKIRTIGDDVELDKNSRIIFSGRVYGLMGTDSSGHDLALGWVWGARYALMIGGTIAILTVVLGTLYGMTSAYFGGWVDEVMQRLNEIILGINAFIIVILIMYLWKKSVWVFIGVYGALQWRGIAKIIRSRGLQIRQDTYIEAAESLGSSGGRIIRKHMIPQILPYSVAEAALMVPLFVMTEAGLSVLGLGDPNIVTWGTMLSEAREHALAGGYWWWVLLPGLGLILLGFSFIASGMAIEKVVNPKMRQR
ncbi:MAG: ABC transporter permease subunit [Thermoplasmatota archaeon]